MMRVRTERAELLESAGATPDGITKPWRTIAIEFMYVNIAHWKSTEK